LHVRIAGASLSKIPKCVSPQSVEFSARMLVFCWCRINYQAIQSNIQMCLYSRGITLEVWWCRERFPVSKTAPWFIHASPLPS